MRSTTHLKLQLGLLFNLQWMMTLRHLHQQHLESLWSVLTFCPEYPKGRKGLLYQKVVKLGKVQWYYCWNRPYLAVYKPRSPICRHCRIRSQLKQYAFTSAYGLQLITIWISDCDKEKVTAPAPAKEYICKPSFLTSDYGEKPVVNQFCYVSAVSWLQWPTCFTWYCICVCATVEWTVWMF